MANLQSTLESAAVERWHGGTNFTVDFIFENPGETILIFARTIGSGSWILFSMFGQILSGFTLAVPLWYILVFMFVLMVSVFYGEKDSWTPKWKERCVYIVVIVGVVIMSMLGMFLAWTPDTSLFILGLQGRYFLPILPLGMLFFRNKIKIDKPLIPYALIATSIFMHFLILRYVLDFTIARL